MGTGESVIQNRSFNNEKDKFRTFKEIENGIECE